MENIEEKIIEIAPAFFLVVMLLPIIFASIGGAKFMEAAENLKKDGENFQYKKSLLIAKELLICAFFSCGVWLSFCIVGESIKGTWTRIMMVSYKMASIGVILAYFTIFVMLIHEKNILDNDVYKKMLSKHKKKLTIIFLIIFIVYISWYTYWQIRYNVLM